jgi:hypothetical protein
MGTRNGKSAKFWIIGGCITSYNISYPGLASQSTKTRGSLKAPWKILRNYSSATGMLQSQIRICPRNVVVARLEDAPRFKGGRAVTYIVGPVSILYEDTCTRVLRMPRNRKNICVVIYTCYHMLLYNIAINTSHVIDCKEVQKDSNL